MELEAFLGKHYGYRSVNLMGAMQSYLVIICMAMLLGCSTQRYGRESNLSSVEIQEFTCRDIRIETAKSAAFLQSVQAQRSGLNGAQVLGIIGDFGIGNAMEGSEAEDSGNLRMQQLQQLAIQKGCSRLRD